MTRRLRHLAIPLFLLACLVAGGASAAGYWANLALQLAALPIIVAAAIDRRGTPLPAQARQALILLAALIALILVQLVPLPPAIWTHLPGRGPVAAGFTLLGLPLPWLPISLEPYRTIASALWLLPAVAVFLGVATLGLYRASWIAWVLAGVSLVSVALGALQRAGGEQSGAYLYQITNFGTMTGFFANANHLGTLLIATIPFLAGLYLNAVRKGRSLQKSSGLLIVLVGTAMILVVGLVGATSLAAIGIAVPVTVASAMLVYSARRRLPGWTAAVLALVLAASVAAVFASPFDNNLTGNSAYRNEDSRRTSFTLTAGAARDFLPLGSGIGSFQEVYRTRENPATIDRYYMNHSHGDYFEIALETGIPGLLLVVAFAMWWLRRSVALWRDAEADPFAKAATIAIGAILAHSIVDYPMRTAAVSAIFAASCALIAEARPRAGRGSRHQGTPAARHLSAD
jgi:O-antigen ligase